MSSWLSKSSTVRRTASRQDWRHILPLTGQEILAHRGIPRRLDVWSSGKTKSSSRLVRIVHYWKLYHLARNVTIPRKDIHKAQILPLTAPAVLSHQND